MRVAQTIPSAEHPVSDRPATRGAWQIDPLTSRVEFTVRKRWFVVPLRVTGRFSDVQGVIPGLYSSPPGPSGHAAAASRRPRGSGR
jgi:polyisoprenoid-binding protein YceI